MEKLYCNCNYIEVSEADKEELNGNGILLDVALCFVSWKASLAITLIDYAAEFFVGTTVTGWIASNVSKTILNNLGGSAKVTAYQPSPMDSGYPPNSYQGFIWAQQQRKLRYTKA